MKKLLKSKLFWLVVIILVAFGIWVSISLGGVDETAYTTETAQTGALIQTVTATGEVESSNEIDLNFKTSGRLTILNVNEGDKVQSGQVLASIDTSGLSAQVSQYRANVSAAQADLERIKAGSSVEEIDISREKVSKSRSDLNSLMSKRNNETETLRETVLNSLNNSVFTAIVALDEVYNHLINDDTTRNLQLNNSSLFNDLASDYIKVKSKLENSNDIVSLANSEKSDSSITSAANALGGVLTDLNKFLDKAFGVADTIIVNAFYTQASKDAIKSDITTQQSTNNASLISIQSSKSNLINTIDSYASQIQSAESALAIAEAELNLVTAGPRSFDVNSAQAKVAQAQAQLNKSLADLRDYNILAPINGTVTEVNFNLGEQTSVAVPVVKMLSTEKFEIGVDIAESDIAKIELADEVIIELDAFGSDQLFVGSIVFIDPAQTVISDVTYYRTTVSLESNDWTDKVKPGMSADVTITTEEKDDVLYIPQRAVKIREAILGEVPEKYVEVLVDGAIKEKVIKIGLRGDNGLVEVLSGISTGDMVVTFKKNNK
jgi:HlyD family secretion protein